MGGLYGDRWEIENNKKRGEQLVGVDTAYFNQLIEQLKEESGKAEGFTVDMNHIASLVDKIF